MHELNNWDEDTINHIRAAIWAEERQVKEAIAELDGKLKAGDSYAMQELRRLNGRYQGLEFFISKLLEMQEDNAVAIEQAKQENYS